MRLAVVALCAFAAALVGAVLGRVADEQVRAWRWRRARREAVARCGETLRAAIAADPSRRCARCDGLLVEHAVVTNEVGAYAECNGARGRN